MVKISPAVARLLLRKTNRFLFACNRISRIACVEGYNVGWEGKFRDLSQLVKYLRDRKSPRQKKREKRD